MQKDNTDKRWQSGYKSTTQDRSHLVVRRESCAAHDGASVRLRLGSPGNRYASVKKRRGVHTTEAGALHRNRY